MPNNHSAIFTEIKKDKKTAARVGVLTVNGFSIKTPILWLGHNFKSSISLWDIDRLNVPGMMANACHVVKNPAMARSIYDKGIHHHLGYKGPIVMDSGGFLFQKSHNMAVRPSTIADVYREAKVDIGVTLDHPLSPSLSASLNMRRWERTLRNTEIMVSKVNSCALMPVVHGYTLRALERACIQIKNIVGDPVLIGIGSLVPLMKTSCLGNGIKYKRNNGMDGNHVTYIADALKLVRSEFPKSLLHVFGVGGITTVLTMFALGADSADSVAWRLKAGYGAIQLPGISDRFLTPRPNSTKTRRVIDEHEEIALANCGCPICARFRRLGWQKRLLDNSFKSRTIHNAWVFLEEVRDFRKAVQTGRGYGFAVKRLSRSHHFFPLFNQENNETFYGQYI